MNEALPKIILTKRKCKNKKEILNIALHSIASKYKHNTIRSTYVCMHTYTQLFAYTSAEKR